MRNSQWRNHIVKIIQGIIITNGALKRLTIHRIPYTKIDKCQKQKFLKLAKKALGFAHEKQTVERGTVNYVNFFDYFHVKFHCSDSWRANLIT